MSATRFHTDPKSSKQVLAEANVDQFRQQLGPFVVAAETTLIPMLFTDALEADQPIIFANESFCQLTGYRTEEVLGQSFHALLASGTAPTAMANIAAAFNDGSDVCSEVHYNRKNDVEFWASLFISPVRDQQGRIVQYFVSIVDLTKQKYEQAHGLMLIDELNHRVKNTLFTVHSIVSQALRRSSDREIAAVIEARLLALSRSHDLLTVSNWEPVGLMDTVARALDAFDGGTDYAARFSVTGDNLPLTTKATLALSIGFHELATNAVKYGALSNPTGHVAITWKSAIVDHRKRLQISWSEAGGPLVVPPTRQGFGSRVLERGLGYELGGKVDLAYLSTGFVCTIDIPLPIRSE